MKWINDNKILIVGLGLIGGSYAKALTRLGYHVIAIDKRLEAIEYAIKNNIIEDGSVETTEEIVKSADAVIFALYPQVFKDWIIKYQDYLKKDIRITDVTGVKGCIVYDIQSILRDDVEYIAAHPMAGKEVYGVENADDSIFHEANYIVTPTDKNTQGAIEWCKSLGRILGFRNVAVLSPEEHDEMIGYLSQLTHIIAVSLMTCKDNQHFVDYTGDSFRDLTRIANINDAMWSELFKMNKEVLIEELSDFTKELETMKKFLVEDDIEGMREKMRISTARRAYFNK